MEHIDDWASVKEHKFENMIVLCATCHSRVTSKEIHKDAIRTYKRNLAIISGRYSLYEIRLFQAVYSKIDEQPLSFRIAENDFLHVKGAVDDKLFQVVKLGLSVSIGGVSVSPLELVLTDLGRTFIRQFFEGKLIE